MEDHDSLYDEAQLLDQTDCVSNKKIIVAPSPIDQTALTELFQFSPDELKVSVGGALCCHYSS